MGPRWAWVGLYVVGASGCVAPQVDVPMVITWPVTERGTVCEAPVDMLVVDLFEYTGDPERRSRAAGACGRCAYDDEDGSCRRIERRCQCGGPLTSPEDISEAFRGVRFDDVGNERQICVRVVGVQRGAAAAPVGDCSESPECAADADIADTAQFCILSQLGTVSEASPLLQINELSCVDLDPFVQMCSDEGCGCTLESVTSCRMMPVPPECRPECGPEVQIGCFTGSVACNLVELRALTTPECAGF